jgi:hypothetical protein
MTSTTSEVVQVFGRRQCQTSRDFVPWRFLDAGRHSVWKGSSCRRPKTCTNSDITENIRQRIETAPVCWAWVANLILLHNFKVFALKIKRGTLALLDQQ